MAKKFISTIFLFCMLIFQNCTKESQSNIPPKIEFLKENGFLSQDSAIPMGEKIKIGIISQKNDENITFFNVSLENDSLKTLLDSGMNSEKFVYHCNFIKTNAKSDKLIFFVMDKNRNKSTISLSLTKTEVSKFGKIKNFVSKNIGGQKNSQFGSFFSLNEGKLFTQNEASQQQNLIDIIYYFDIFEATLSSPNESDVASVFNDLTNWVTKNETRYHVTNLTEKQFDEAKNDSLLIVSFDQTLAKRKAKYVSQGQIFAFRNHSGEIGLIKIISVEKLNTGKILIDIKVQE